MKGQQAARFRAVPAELRGWVDNRLVNTHIRIVRMMVLGTLLNAFAMLLVLFKSVSHAQLTLFAAATALAGFHRLWIADSAPPRQLRAQRLMRDFRFNSWFLGLAQGVPMALWLPHVPAGAQLLLAVCGLTQIASAAYTMRTLRLSATAYIALLTLGLAIGLARIGTPAALPLKVSAISTTSAIRSP